MVSATKTQLNLWIRKEMKIHFLEMVQEDVRAGKASKSAKPALIEELIEREYRRRAKARAARAAKRTTEKAVAA